MDSDPTIKRVRLFHTNDLHRRLEPFKDGTGGADRFVGKIRELEAANPGSITVNVGDVAGDNRAHGPDHFQPVPELFNQAGIDILALGNHEFEDPSQGYKSLQEGLVAPFQGETLVANVTHADGTPIKGTKPYTIRKLQEQSIAFIGVVTRDLASAMFPAAGAGLATLPIEDTLRELVARVRAEGADAVVVLGHESTGQMKAITKNVPGIDLSLAAHDHFSTEQPLEVVRDDGSKGWVAQADAYGKSVGEVDLLFEAGRFAGVEGRLHRVDQSAPSDPVAKHIMETYQPPERIKHTPPAKKETTVLTSFAELAKMLQETKESEGTSP